MTKQRPDSWICKDNNGQTNKDCPHENAKQFNSWVRLNLPDSTTGFCASDIDFVLWNWKTKKIMFIEVKTRNAIIKPFQRHMFKLIHKWLKFAISEIGNGWQYLGYNLVSFENTNFENGKCYLNNNEIEECELINVLSF